MTLSFLNELRIFAAVLALCLGAAGARAADEKLGLPPPARVVRFPDDRSVGWLRMRDWGRASQWQEVYYFFGINGEARGVKIVPAGKETELHVQDELTDLAFLDGFNPDDLQYLELNGAATPDGIQRLARITGLRSLDIRAVELNAEGFEALAKLPRLTNLSLFTMNKRDTFEGIGQLSALRLLETLSIGGGQGLTDATMHEFGQITSLSKLEIGSARLTGRGIKGLSGLSRLRMISFSDCPRLRGEHLVALRRLPRLERAIFDSCPRVGDEAAPILGSLRTLELLVLFTTGLTDDGVNELGRWLPNCQIETDRKLIRSPAPDPPKPIS